ncbi:MBL fold metallo-hydrolase [candidate division WOR-3 bacterium]|uniref:MBL fold metallo-hydrolase n=1 Tax=candidate division WOR-3 bacterium TaxID=2052148 RepID=A0A9D5K7P7_UNCW3|nr:MBL fold metallo-hydrolase [candidate division WOR-3 bacterium]MBD3363605.1 MBL fold metallo-hydrolase [candidate division WOR-3 bacterium]
MSKTKLILLGTGTPNADPDRWGPALAVVVNRTPYIVDAGPGVVRRAVEAGLDVKHLTRVFLTHLHSDHTVGLPDLILTPWVLGRSTPLEVWGPPGTRNMSEHILKAYSEDVRERSEGLQPSNDTGWKTITHEISEPGIIYSDDNLEVEAFPVDHGSWKAYGYKFVTSDRSIVISADTAPTELMIQKAKGCDILVHEVYSLKGLATRPSAWQRYHTAVHTSANQLAEIAKKARPKFLVLYHQLFWGASDEDLLAEIRKGYAGKVVSGRDLEVY